MIAASTTKAAKAQEQIEAVLNLPMYGRSGGPGGGGAVERWVGSSRGQSEGGRQGGGGMGVGGLD
jgi:hypothetical protein